MKRILLTLTCVLWLCQLLAQDKQMFVFLNNYPEKEVLSKREMDSLQSGHLANIKRLALRGDLMLAGPFDGGGGIFVLNSAVHETAKEILSTDPAIAANRYRIEILPFTARNGRLCLPAEDAGFAEWTFVRYTTHITKFNVQDAPKLLKVHDDYIKELIITGNVIYEGIFDNSDGGIIIMQGEVAPEVIMSDPTVKQGFIYPEIKKLWTAKGAFCKN